MPPYPAAVLRRLAEPAHAGTLTAADAVGEAGAPGCGDVVRIQLALAGDRIAAARFQALGCPAATAAAEELCDRVQGGRLDDALRLSAATLDRGLGGLGAARHHGPVLAVDALARALEGWYSARLGAAGPARRPERVAVAMSGGVDSAVAAMLLRDAGWDVVGVTMRLWHDPAAAAAERSCCSPETVQAARATAHALGLPHLTLDAVAPFRAGVVEEFIAGYAAGRTPNPCVTCNGSVRFRLLDQAAALLGAGRLATGHYAQRVAGPGGRAALAPARDAGKDQSYMLALLEPAMLERLVFPLGTLTKDEVRARARAAALPCADAVESQEVCFVGEGGYVPFLERNAGLAARRGEVVDRDGRVLGTHEGYWRYTVGQRRGLGVAGPEPLYVLATDAAANRVVVGPRSALAAWSLVLEPARAHAAIDPERPFEVRVRYRGRPLAGRAAVPGEGDALLVALAEPADAVAPGQTAVLHQDGRLVAAGTIAQSRPATRGDMWTGPTS